jgi:hypothetical protein
MIIEYLTPLAVGLIGGEDDRSGLIESWNQLEEGMCTVYSKRQVSNPMAMAR